jgi:hypothetical protein
VSEGGVDLNRSEWMILEESCLRGTYRSLVFLLDRLVVYNSLPIWCRSNFQDTRDNVVDFSFQLQPRSGTVETKQSTIPAVQGLLSDVHRFLISLVRCKRGSWYNAFNNGPVVAPINAGLISEISAPRRGLGGLSGGGHQATDSPLHSGLLMGSCSTAMCAVLLCTANE